MRVAQYFFRGADFFASRRFFNSSFCSSVIWGLNGSLINLSGGLLDARFLPFDASEFFIGDDVELDFEIDLVTLKGVAESIEITVVDLEGFISERSLVTSSLVLLQHMNLFLVMTQF